MVAQDLMRAAHGSYYTYYLEDHGLAFFFNGGHTINIYCTDGGHCVDCFTIESKPDQRHATTDQARHGIRRYIEAHYA